MGWVRRAGILLVVAVLALGLGGAVAGAKKKHRKGTTWTSKVTLTHPLANQFKGEVTSKLAGCESSRVVTLFYTDPDTNLTTLLSVQRTDGKGRYQVVLTKDAFFGTYQVQVAQRKIRAFKTKQTCKTAESPALVVQ